MQKAKLWYFVHTTNLVYRDDITGKWVCLQAMSGGRRGQRIGNAVLPYGVNNSRLFSSISEREKHVGCHRGGPIPKGVYEVGVLKHRNFGTAQSPKMVYSAELKPPSVTPKVAASSCPSSNGLGQSAVFGKGSSGSLGFEITRLSTDVAIVAV